MLCAEAAFDAVQAGRQHDELTAYPAAFEKSWLHAELKKARNFKAWFKKGLLVATLMNGIGKGKAAIQLQETQGCAYEGPEWSS